MKFHFPHRSVKSYLLAWIIAPITLFILADSVSLYHSTLASTNTAYDRMLVTTAYSVGDSIRMENGQLQIPVSYAALEVYEAEFSTRMIYRVNNAKGEFIAGDSDLPSYAARLKQPPISPTLLGVYNSQYGEAEVRVATVYQPVVSEDGRSGIIIQIAEPLEFRTSLVRKISIGMFVRQSLLLLFVSVVTVVVVTRALRPLDQLRSVLDEREHHNLAPIDSSFAPTELHPLIETLNHLMTRLNRALGLQQRFVADASHQLRTPLAVLKAQAQSGLRGDAPLEIVIREIARTADRATNLANQLLSLAKVEHLRGKGRCETCDLSAIAQDVAVELSPLISERNLDFEFETIASAAVPGHPWMINELISNLLLNAINHSPADSKLGIRIARRDEALTLAVWDSGAGLSSEVNTRAFEPFAAAHGSTGVGLGLTICSEIADSMGAVLALTNRIADGRIVGLDAVVQFRIAGGRA
jgi:two-component system, OmpR family, sensor histidine kinase TctE